MTATNERLKVNFTEKEKNDLNNFVSDPDSNIYSIKNLVPQDVAYTICRTSRSPLSFKRMILQLLETDEISKVDLHGSSSGICSGESVAKYGIEYGHSSIMELASVAMGFEGVSRHFANKLFLSGKHNSFTAFSQRYQRVFEGSYHVPSVLHDLEDSRKHIEIYTDYHDAINRIYNQIVKKLTKYYLGNDEFPEDMPLSMREKKIIGKVFEDARYVTTLASHTNLGMVGNALSIRNSINNLLSTGNCEDCENAELMKEHAEHVVPALMRHIGRHENVGHSEHLLDNLSKIGTMGSENTISIVNNPYQMILDLSVEQRRDMEVLFQDGLPNHEMFKGYVRGLLHGLGPHDHPHDVTRGIYIKVMASVSESCWAQWLRHNRSSDFIYEKPTVMNGYVMPQSIKDAGCEHLFMSAINLSMDVYNHFSQFGLGIEEYVVTNAHKRRIVCNTNLWSLYWFINLRMSQEAQWEIRDLAEWIYGELMQDIDFAIEGAPRRK